MKAFVTGATGLLGSNLVRLLVEQDHEVKVLVRSTEKAKQVLGDLSDVKIVKGDMDNLAAWLDELDGTDVLFHTAAYFREYYQPGDHEDTLNRINVKAMINLLEEADKRKVGKVIHVSSSGVIGKNPNGSPSDETTPPDAGTYANLYYKSKIAGNKAIDEFLEKHSLPVVLILPGAIIGPSDSAPTTMGRLVLDFLAKKLPGILEGGFSMVDARDVAQAMINAVERGKSKERYLLGGSYASLDKITKTLEKVSGVPAPKLHIPYAVSLGLAYVLQMVAKLTNKPSIVTVDAVKVLKHGVAVTSVKAERELGATFRSLEDSLRDTVNWYRKHNFK